MAQVLLVFAAKIIQACARLLPKPKADAMQKIADSREEK